MSSHIELVVSDSGQGIDPGLVPQLFQRFRQADRTTARDQRGLGIGLALVKELVELHGGTVAAGSPGLSQGAMFTITLPLPIHPTLAAPGAVHPSAWRATAADFTAALDGVKILIVDDERDTLQLFERVLEAAGAHVRAAATAAEAVSIVEAWRPDVLVSDIGLPSVDGYTLIEQVRALTPERGGSVPAVAVTAYASVHDRIRILSAGFQLHLPKPVEPAELLAIVSNLAARTPARR